VYLGDSLGKRLKTDGATYGKEEERECVGGTDEMGRKGDSKGKKSPAGQGEDIQTNKKERRIEGG